MISHPQAPCNPADVRVDCDSFINPESVIEYNVRRLPADTGKCEKCVHIGGDISVIFLNKRLCCPDYVFCFVFIEPATLNYLLNIFRLCTGKVPRSGIVQKQILADGIYNSIGGLCREYGKDKYLKLIFEFEKRSGRIRKLIKRDENAQNCAG